MLMNDPIIDAIYFWNEINNIRLPTIKINVFECKYNIRIRSSFQPITTCVIYRALIELTKSELSRAVLID